MEEDIIKLGKEIEPFLNNGVVTSTSEFKWLASKGVLREGQDLYKNVYSLVYPKSMTFQEVSQRYMKLQNDFEYYFLNRHKVKLGSIKKETNENEINAEEIPF